MDDTTEKRPPRILLSVVAVHLLVSLLILFFWISTWIGAFDTVEAVDTPVWLSVLAAVITFPAVLLIPLLHLNSGMNWIAALILVPLNSVFWGWVAARIKYRRPERSATGVGLQ